MVCAPSARSALGVQLQEPLADTVAVQIVAVPSLTVRVMPAVPLPVILGRLLLVGAPATGALITGALGGMAVGLAVGVAVGMAVAVAVRVAVRVAVGMAVAVAVGVAVRVAVGMAVAVAVGVAVRVAVGMAVAVAVGMAVAVAVGVAGFTVKLRVAAGETRSAALV